jgi:hypothetical protein
MQQVPFETCTRRQTQILTRDVKTARTWALKIQPIVLLTPALARCKVFTQTAVNLPCGSGKHVRVFQVSSEILQAYLLFEANLDRDFHTAVSKSRFCRHPALAVLGLSMLNIL